MSRSWRIAVMPGDRSRTSGTAIRRNGTPPYAKTITANTGLIHSLPGNAGTENPSHSWSISL